MRKPTLTEMFTAAASTKSAYDFARNMHARMEERFFYSVKIEFNDYAYRPASDWLMEQTNSRNSLVHSDKEKNYTPTFGFNGESPATHLTIKGHRVKVEASASDPSASMYSPGRGKEIVFISRTKAGIDAVKELIAELVIERRTRSGNGSLYTFANYWEHKSIPKRYLSSIFLPGNDKENLLADLDSFFENEEKYLEIGIPWHRGYLLYGPPGTGKTSMALALANHYGKDLYSLNLSSVKSDSKLTEVMNDIESNQLLVIEDIDIFSSATGRGGGGDITLAGLLNVLDGVHTPHGLVTFMTSNHPEQLDPALVRSGRIDYRLHLDRPTEDQIRRMFHHVYGEELKGGVADFDSMAEVTDVFKRNIDNPDLTALELTMNQSNINSDVSSDIK